MLVGDPKQISSIRRNF